MYHEVGEEDFDTARAIRDSMRAAWREAQSALLLCQLDEELCELSSMLVMVDVARMEQCCCVGLHNLYIKGREHQIKPKHQ